MILDLINSVGGRKMVLSCLAIAAITLLAALDHLTMDVMIAIVTMATGFNAASAYEDGKKATATEAGKQMAAAAAKESAKP